MNLIEPLSQEVVSRDLPPTVALSFTVFLGAALGGFYFFDMLQRWKKTEEKLHQIEQTLEETTTMVEAHADTIHEHDQRIRGKQDYDESEELEENTYQAWQGDYHQDFRKIEIMLWREKQTKVKENQAWIAWTGEKDGSTSVRDFYLGNSNPEFQWEIREGDYYYILRVSETFVESWNSSIRLEIFMTFGSQQNLLEFVGEESFHGNQTMNLALKRCLESKDLHWQRILKEISSFAQH
jgi:hypothetical protein